MKGENIKIRIRGLVNGVLDLSDSFPKTAVFKVFTDQIIRSSTSVGANYRAACRSKSRRDFVNKMKIVEEELDETIYWLEAIEDRKIFPVNVITKLIVEGNELLAIVVKSIQTARANETGMNK